MKSAAARRDHSTYQDVKRSGIAERILEDLRNQILDGTLPRGAKLPTERELAEGYGVSGPTVREAIRGLTAIRLVQVRHGSGAFVTADGNELVAASLHSMIQLERIGFSDVVGVFGALNAYAAELAAVHATEGEIVALRSALDRIENSTDANGIVVALTEFLEGLASAARNPLLAALCKFLAGLQIGLACELCGESFDLWRDTSARLAAERKQVVDAIAARDPQAACALTRNYHQRALAVIAALPGAVAARLSDPTFSNVLRSLPSQPRSITPRS